MRAVFDVQRASVTVTVTVISLGCHSYIRCSFNTRVFAPEFDIYKRNYILLFEIGTDQVIKWLKLLIEIRNKLAIC